MCAVHVVLREKSIPFTTSLGMLRHGVGLIDILHERSLTGTAPVIQHGPLWLAESLAIVEYLEEIQPTPRMLPADLADRARARQVMMWMRLEHDPLRRERPAEGIMYPRRDVAPLSPAAARAAESLVRVADKLGVDARGHAFDRFGVVDVELAFALMRLVSSGYAVPDPVRAYVETIWHRPSMREFIDHPRPPNAPD